MAAHGEDQEMKQKQNESPASDGSNLANHQQNVEKSNIAAIFIGLFESNSIQHALFVNSCPNSERLDNFRRDYYYKAFTVELPQAYSSSRSKLLCGIPYLFSSRFEKFPAESSIYMISCEFDDILPMNPRDSVRNPAAPIIRGTLHETRGRFCVLRLTELPPVQLFSAPEIQVYYDQVANRPGFSLGNDILLETRRLND
jgi:hypothetical protein